MRISDWSSDVCSSDLPTSKSWLQKFLGVDAPETRIEKASNAVDLFQKMMVAATDSLATNNRTAELTPMARKDLDAHPDQVFVVEVYVPATDTGAEHILKREDFTVYGLGEDVYDALWKNNPVKTGVRNRAIDYSRSYFLIAVMVDGVLQWRMVPRPRSEEHTSELQSLMRISYAVFCLKKTK